MTLLVLFRECSECSMQLNVQLLQLFFLMDDLVFSMLGSRSPSFDQRMSLKCVVKAKKQK